MDDISGTKYLNRSRASSSSSSEASIELLSEHSVDSSRASSPRNFVDERGIEISENSITNEEDKLIQCQIS